MDFTITLHTIAGGPDDWLVRYETHGGHPHRHFRWDDEGPQRHRRLHSWPFEHKQIVDRAIQDIKDHWMEYVARYDAWKQTLKQD